MTKILEQTLSLEELKVDGFEKVYYVTDPSVGLKAIICIHNTTLGPALGGTRIFPYQTMEEALTDVTRLARGMTYKSAIVDVGLGGGKSVIFASAKTKTPEMLQSFADAIHQLGGIYTAAEDVGCTTADVAIIGERTPYVVGLVHEKSSGNPSHFTAWGTFRGIQAALKHQFGSDSVAGKVIAIQGLGAVGSLLLEHLFWHGAKLIVSDIDWQKTQRLAKQYGAVACPTEDILQAKCDVLAPCALGGTINSKTIPQLNCKVVAGCANNQLLEESDGDLLRKRGILYAPDFVINGGGLINVANELLPGGYNPKTARDKVDAIYQSLLDIFAMADKNNYSTHKAAVALCDHRLESGLGKREHPPVYHHYKNG
ncbi:MAG: Glu/Leu/Phe/Val dehydrogenase [Verrucomicrobia bacterium]|nr:Glu/Leu/Phe/Val dehydrogenase [Verrucomicrobiota bacterium]